MKEELKIKERKARISISDGENEHDSKETTEDFVPESNLELEDQHKDKFGLRSPINKTRYKPQEDER